MINYIPQVQKYVEEILMGNKYPIKTNKHDKYIYCIVVIEQKTKDIIFFKINRDFNKKSYFKFLNDLPHGKFEITNKMKKLLIKII